MDFYAPSARESAGDSPTDGDTSGHERF